MKALSPEAIMRSYRAHAVAESHLDIDATMDTVGPEPVYELWPRGIRMVGYDTIREFYRRMFEGFFPLFLEEPSEELEPAYGDFHIAVEANLNVRGPDGETIPLRCNSVVRVNPDSGLLLGETVYFDNDMDTLVFKALGDDFFALPGVSVIKAVVDEK